MSRNSNSAPAPVIRVLLAVVALAFIYSMTLAARNGLADIYAEPARKLLQDKRDAGVVLTEAEWQAIDTNLSQSLRFAPNNPDTLSELGRLHRISLEQDDIDPVEIERHGNLALDYYARAAKLRPAWAWGWISLAQVRWELYQDSGNAYHQALIYALHFGPWDRDIQFWAVGLALDTWGTLSPEASDAVLTMIDRSFERAPEVLEPIDDTEWSVLCNAVELRGGREDELRRLQRHCEEEI